MKYQMKFLSSSSFARRKIPKCSKKRDFRMDRGTDHGDKHVHSNFFFYDKITSRTDGDQCNMTQWSRIVGNARKDKYFAEGILLKSLEKTAAYPSVGVIFWDMTYICPTISSPSSMRKPSMETIEPISSTSLCVNRDNSMQFKCHKSKFGSFVEEHSIGREGISPLPKRPSSPNTVYYLMAFKTQGNALSLTSTWRTWTGADFILWKCPKDLCLQRVSFYRHLEPQDDDIMFTLMIECSEGLTNIQAALNYLERLRDRRCGYVGIYSITEIY